MRIESRCSALGSESGAQLDVREMLFVRYIQGVVDIGPWFP